MSAHELDATAGALLLQLSMIGASEPGEFIQINHRRPEGHIVRAFHAADQPGRLVGKILALGDSSDVLIGAAPRMRRHRAAVEHTRVLWAVADTDSAADRLRSIDPAPSLLVRAGAELTGWWALAEAVPVDELRPVLPRLASSIGGDQVAAHPGALLRPVGVWAAEQAERVVLDRAPLIASYEAIDVVGGLSELGDPHWTPELWR